MEKQDPQCEEWRSIYAYGSRGYRRVSSIYVFLQTASVFCQARLRRDLHECSNVTLLGSRHRAGARAYWFTPSKGL